MEELSEALQWLRLSHPVPMDMLEHIYDNLLPLLLESTDLLKYSGPAEVLRDVERQLLPLARLPRLKARVRTMLFSKSLSITHGSLLSQVRALQGACNEVRCSASFRRVLETVLRVGNYLNHGVDTPDDGGEVRGFAIESLLRLRDFRAAQGGDVSALHCVVLHLMPADAHLCAQLRSDLPCLLASSPCVGEGISDLREAVGRFQSEIDLVQCEIDRFGDSYKLEGEIDGAGPLMALQQLVEDATEIANTLNSQLSSALEATWSLLEYFGERRGEPTQDRWAASDYAAVERFFSTVREFTTSLEECWREVVDQPRKLRIEGMPVESAGSALACDDSPSHSRAPPEAAVKCEDAPRRRAAALAAEVASARQGPSHVPRRVVRCSPSVSLAEEQ